MTKREKISAKVKANYIKIDNLNEENRELLRKSYLLSDDKQNFIEKKETSGKGKNKITQLVGRIHWV